MGKDWPGMSKHHQAIPHPSTYQSPCTIYRQGFFKGLARESQAEADTGNPLKAARTNTHGRRSLPLLKPEACSGIFCGPHGHVFLLL